MSLNKESSGGAIINARGPFSPLGVSRSPEPVASAAAKALLDFADISVLQETASTALSSYASSESATVVHCAAAGITLAVSGAMTGSDPKLISALPDTTGLRNRVVLPACHAVDYGHPIEQAIRLSGAIPVLAGKRSSCSILEIDREIDHADTCCLLLVISRLTTGKDIDIRAAIETARKRGVPIIIDGAAQFFRVQELISLGADLVIVSAQKYLAAPTAGLLFGKSRLIESVRKQENGIGRGMKATKESLCGVIAALQQWKDWNEASWALAQREKVLSFNERLSCLKGVIATSEEDPTGGPFSRACLKIDSDKVGRSASEVVNSLREGSPAIWAMDHRVRDNEILFELIPLDSKEIDVIVERVAELLD